MQSNEHEGSDLMYSGSRDPFLFSEGYNSDLEPHSIGTSVQLLGSNIGDSESVSMALDDSPGMDSGQLGVFTIVELEIF